MIATEVDPEAEKIVVANSNQEFSTDLLRVYYDRLFPYKEMFNWLSYGGMEDGSEYFNKREWSFTIEDDIYIRYQSFKNLKEFKTAIQKRQPHKIDIGAVFSAAPKDHTTVKAELFNPVERELVFDIDMTDYDDIRNCCTGANICKRCWPYMTMALKVIDEALREDFAFKHILWIYSGRRGIHCWVSDDEARELPNDARGAIVKYLSVDTGSAENSDKKMKHVFTAPIHPMMKRAYDTLEPYFRDNICDYRGKGPDAEGQGLLATKAQYMKILNSLPNEQIRTELFNEWGRSERLTGAERWNQLKNAITAPESNQINNKRKRMNYPELDAWRMELVFTHCYPRLDVNVSKSQNHLLKSPFCIHPKTGRVCVPIDPSKADDFNPFTVPTVRTLIAEIDGYTGPECEDRKKTSMNKALEDFHKTFWNDMSDSIRKQNKDKAERMDAMNVVF